MDDHSSRSGYTCCQGDEEKISYLLDHLPASSSPYSSATCAVGFPSSKAEQMPSSSSYPIASSSAAGGGGDGGGKRFLDQDFDSLDCESEVEGVEVFEEPAKSVAVRSSGSKRSRAAEVHNMSEKRRRSRINEKMRALQNLIPNSNKTDKASMLDEAIEYLKQLQLQVQILSMRNGVNLHTMYMSGALEPLQTCQMSIGFGLDGDPAMNIGSINIGSAALPLSQDLAAQTSLDMSNRCASSHPPTLTTPGLVDVANSQAPLVNSMQSHLGSFQVPVPCESIFTGEMSAAHMQLAAAISYTQNLSENERNSAAAHAKLVGGQTSSGVGLDRLEECMLGKEERGGEMLSNEEAFIQHLQGLEDLFQVLMPRNDAIKISESAMNAFALLTNFEVPEAT